MTTTLRDLIAESFDEKQFLETLMDEIHQRIDYESLARNYLEAHLDDVDCYIETLAASAVNDLPF